MTFPRFKFSIAAAVAACSLALGGTAQAQTTVSAGPPILPPPPNDCRADYGTGHAQAALEGLACPSASPKAVRGNVTSTGLREMDDSTDVNALASGYPAYAGYTDGLYQSYGDIRARFGSVAQTVGIDVLGGSARATDLEPSPGAFQNNPYSAGPWARGQINNTSNKRPIIYTMGSWVPQIEQSLAWNGVPHCSSPSQQGCYLEWVAIWDNNPVLYGNEDAHQFINHGPNYENRDRSVYNPSALFPSAPPPPPMHYERYAQQTLTTPWGKATRQEFAWVYNYDWARPFYPTAYKQLTINVQEKMRWWANQLAYRIHHSSAATNAANWRYQRFGELTARYKGKRCDPAGWDACVNG